jgi:hypothetical protein
MLITFYLLIRYIQMLHILIIDSFLIIFTLKYVTFIPFLHFIYLFNNISKYSCLSLLWINHSMNTYFYFLTLMCSSIIFLIKATIINSSYIISKFLKHYLSFQLTHLINLKQHHLEI